MYRIMIRDENGEWSRPELFDDPEYRKPNLGRPNRFDSTNEAMEYIHTRLLPESGDEADYRVVDGMDSVYVTAAQLARLDTTYNFGYFEGTCSTDPDTVLELRDDGLPYYTDDDDTDPVGRGVDAPISPDDTRRADWLAMMREASSIYTAIELSQED